MGMDLIPYRGSVSASNSDDGLPFRSREFTTVPRWRKNIAPLATERMPFVASFDDARALYYPLYETAAALGVPTTNYIHTDYVGNATSLSIEQVNEIVDAGHDIQSHSTHNQDLSALTEAELTTDFSNVEDWCDTYITNPDYRLTCMATPLNISSTLVRLVGSRFYAHIRGGVGNELYNGYSMYNAVRSNQFTAICDAASASEATIRARVRAGITVSNDLGCAWTVAGHDTIDMTQTQFGWFLDELLLDPRIDPMTASEYATWLRRRIAPGPVSYDQWSMPFGSRMVWKHPDLLLVPTYTATGMTELPALRLQNTEAAMNTYTFFHDTVAGTPMVISAWIKSATGVLQSGALKLQLGGTAKSTFEDATTGWTRVEWSVTPGATAVGIETGFQITASADVLIDRVQLETGTVASEWVHPYPTG